MCPSDALDLISATEDSCLRFTTPLALDTLNGVCASARGGSRMVGFADDLPYSANPIIPSETI